MAADENSTVILFFDYRFHTHHTRVPTQKLNEICALFMVYIWKDRHKCWVRIEIDSKGVGMIRAEIGLNNRQIINETHDGCH
jgi:hypothetical protein